MFGKDSRRNYIKLIFGPIAFYLLRKNVQSTIEQFNPKAFRKYIACNITVATIANIALYLTKIGRKGAFLTQIQWTIVLLVIATLINLVIIFKRSMREFGAVGIWALFAIYVRHQTV